MPASTNVVNLQIRVTPNASQREITGYIDNVLQVKIAAPPIKGKANKELITFLSNVLEINKSALSIVKGQTSRNKIIAVEGLSKERITNRISDWLHRTK